MECEYLQFSRHAAGRMIQRGITPQTVRRIIDQGQIIERYDDDTPHPSVLVLGFEGRQPVHIVVGQDMDTGYCYVITAYYPDTGQWSTDFRVRRKQ